MVREVVPLRIVEVVKEDRLLVIFYNFYINIKKKF